MPRYRQNNQLVDTESDLLGLTRPNTHDPSRQYPWKGVTAEHEFAALPEVGLEFSARQTRLDYQQPNRERGLYPERFFTPILDVQRLQRVDDNSKIGFNTYTAESDTFKMFIPRPINDEANAPKPARGDIAPLSMAGNPFDMQLT